MRSHLKVGPDRFRRFDVFWIQTDRQTDKQRIEILKKLCMMMKATEFLPQTFDPNIFARYFKL